MRAKMVERRLDAEEVFALCSGAPDADATPFGLLTSGKVATAVRAAVDALPPQAAVVIRARFGLGDEPPRTLLEVATDMGLSRARVRQVEVVALEKIRRAMPTE